MSRKMENREIKSEPGGVEATYRAARKKRGKLAAVVKKNECAMHLTFKILQLFLCWARQPCLNYIVSHQRHGMKQFILCPLWCSGPIHGTKKYIHNGAPGAKNFACFPLLAPSKGAARSRGRVIIRRAHSRFSRGRRRRRATEGGREGGAAFLPPSIIWSLSRCLVHPTTPWGILAKEG